MATRKLIIQPFSQRYTGPGIDGTRVKLEVITACNISEYIFRYRQIPRPPGTATKLGVYTGVCTPVDLEEMPELEPDPNADPPWFRLNYVDLVFRSRTQAAEWKALAYEHITNLLTSLTLMDELLEDDLVTFGDPTCGETSSSDSIESSSSSSGSA